MKKKPSKNTKSTEKYKVIELPSNNEDMEKYVEKNRPLINKNIVASIDYAISKRLPGVEVFSFKDSSFIVILNRKYFKESLESILEFSMNNGQLEICEKVKKMVDKLDKLGYVCSYKKIK